MSKLQKITFAKKDAGSFRLSMKFVNEAITTPLKISQWQTRFNTLFPTWFKQVVDGFLQIARPSYPRLEIGDIMVQVTNNEMEVFVIGDMKEDIDEYFMKMLTELGYICQ